MEPKGLRSKLRELDELIATIHSPEASDASDGTYIGHSPEASAKSNEEIVNEARFQIKYLLFDLEATRRENRYLRQMLERRSNLGEGSDPT